MRSRLILFTLSSYLALAMLGCTSNPSSNSTTDTGNATAGEGAAGKEHKGAKKKGRKSPWSCRPEPL